VGSSAARVVHCEGQMDRSLTQDTRNEPGSHGEISINSANHTGMAFAEKYWMKTIPSLVALATLSILVGSGCAASADDGALENGAGTDEDLRSSGLESIEVSQSEGFRPPPPAGQCWPSSHWTVDFTQRTLKGSACIDGHMEVVDRRMSPAQLARARSSVAAIRTTRKPTACPTDISASSLTLTRTNGSSITYVNAVSACGRGVTAVNAEGLDALIKFLNLEGPFCDENACG
jgi:hypothetical protein